MHVGAAVRATAQLGSEAMLASTIRVVIQPLPKSKAARAAASRELGGIGSTHSPSPAEQEDRAGKQPRLHSQLALQLEVQLSLAHICLWIDLVVRSGVHFIWWRYAADCHACASETGTHNL